MNRNVESLNAIFNKKVHTKAREQFKDKMFGTDADNVVLTWAIGTAENPMGIQYSDEENKALAEKFEKLLSHGRFDFEKIAGKYGNEENSYFIPNITIEDAKSLFGKFDQQSFIFGQKDYDESTGQYYLEMEYWEKADRDNPNSQYELKDMEDHVNDTADAVDYFSKIHGFKFNIPFSIFQASQRFFARYSWKEPFQILSEAKVYIERAAIHSGFNQWQYRARMYHKPQSWELSDGLKNSYYDSWRK